MQLACLLQVAVDELALYARPVKRELKCCSRELLVTSLLRCTRAMRPAARSLYERRGAGGQGEAGALYGAAKDSAFNMLPHRLSPSSSVLSAPLR